MVEPLVKYMASTADLPLHLPNGQNLTIDTYSLTISRWSQKALTNGIVSLRANTYWAVHARNLFGYYKQNSLNCENIIMRGNATLSQATVICNDFGWNIALTDTWLQLILWIQAASKYENCSEYNEIQQKGNITSEILNNILYNASLSILTELQMIQAYIATYYSCHKTFCTYDEMMWMQWSSSIFTGNLTNYLSGIVNPSLTMQDWLPSSLVVPIEWLYYYNSLPISTILAKSLINYDNFLSPNTVKYFFNSYFEGNFSFTAFKFNLPNELYVKSLFNYFQQIVPGSGLFYTAPFHTWVDGFNHPFLSFLYTTSIYEGGNPLAFPFFTVAGNISDIGDTPKTVMESGKDNVKHTRNYYEYYGSKSVIKYGGTLCTFCPNAVRFKQIKIWPVDHILNCTDGGKFISGLTKEDKLFAFVDLLKKIVKITYKETIDYYGLETYKFVVDPEDFQTDAIVPANKYYNQFSWGMSGFYNLTSVFGFSFFMSKPNFYGCDERAVNMSYIYEYTPKNPLSNRLLPSNSDEPYVLINPETGINVKLRFKMMGSMAIYQDYYFNTIAQPVEGKGVYIPYYVLSRFSQWDDSMVQDHFGALMRAHFLKKLLFYLGIISGAFMFEIAFFIAMYIKRNRRKMHHKRISQAILQSVEEERKSRNTDYSFRNINKSIEPR